MDDEALARIEFKVAYLEQAHQELSDVVYAQRQELDRLRARVAALTERLQESTVNPGGFDPGSERPPHY